MATTVAELVAKLSLNSEEFKKGVDEAGRAGDKLSSGFKGVGIAAAAVSTAIVSAGIALVKFATESVQAFETLALATRDLAFVSGGTAEEVSGLIDVLDDYGVSTESVQRSMVFLSRAIQEGNPALEQLKIKIRDTSGHLKTAHDLFYEVIDALKNTRSETERNALAQEIFSRGWTAMLPIIMKGSAAIKEAAAASSLLISEEDIKRAQDYKLALAEFWDAIEKIKLAVARPIIVPITLMIKRYTEGPQIGDQFIDEFGLLNTRTAPEQPDLSGTVRPAAKHYAPKTGPVEGPTPGELKAAAEAKKLLDKMRADEIKGWVELIDEETRVYELGLKYQNEATEAYYKMLDAARANDLAAQVEIAQQIIDLNEKLALYEIELLQEKVKEKEKIKQGELDAYLKQYEMEAQVNKEAWDAVNNLALASAQKMKEVEEKFGSIFDAIAGAFTASFDGVIRGTQTVGEAFRKMGQSIALSIMDLIIKQGLDLLKKKLFESFSPLIQQGLTAIGSIASSASGAVTVPAAAEGGIVTRPTFLLAGEGGQSEAIVPLSKAGEFGFGGGNVFQIDARNSQRGVSAEVMQAIRQGMGQAVKISLARVSDERRRGGMRGLDR